MEDWGGSIQNQTFLCNWNCLIFKKDWDLCMLEALSFMGAAER